MLKRFLSIVILCTCVFNLFSQEDNHKRLYFNAFNEQTQMLNHKTSLSFKRAVFITENAYHNGNLDYDKFQNEISEIANKLETLILQRDLSRYKTAGNWAVFTFMTDSISTNDYQPYVYDFVDFMGEQDWTKMFVTKLMQTKKGNCHSLPYFYKILCEEIGASAHLALAPNHIYIKHLDENQQWANLELTNGGFPRDQWIIKQMAISVEAIKNDIYMAPLSQEESIALTMFDLASAYEFQFGLDSFYLEVIDTALTHFPKCIPLLMCRINYYGNIIKTEQEKTNANIDYIEKAFAKQEETYNTIVSLGHKNTPIELYEQWVETVKQEKQKRHIE
jgi:hypothetical protein